MASRVFSKFVSSLGLAERPDEASNASRAAAVAACLGVMSQGFSSSELWSASSTAAADAENTE